VSRVTDCVFMHALSERSVGQDGDFPIQAEVNRFFDQDDRDERLGFVSADDKNLPRGWYGGTKMLQTPILVGAFNYFRLDDFLSHVAALPWRFPEAVVLVVKQEEHDNPQVFRLRADKTWKEV